MNDKSGSFAGEHGERSSVAQAMLVTAQKFPEKLAYCQLTRHSQSASGRFEDPWYQWGQIAQWVCDAVDALAQQHLPNGSHVASALPNSVQWFVLDFACQLLGLVHVAVDYRWPSTMIARLLKQSDSRFIVCSDKIVETSLFPQQFDLRVDFEKSSISSQDLQRLLELSERTAPDSAAQILFTSGTSGEPKGVMLSHRNLLSNAIAKLDAAPQFATDRRLNVLPFSHAYARTCELSTWVVSQSTLAIAKDWDAFLTEAKRFRPTLVNLVPHLVSKLLHRSEQAVAPECENTVSERLGGEVRLLQVGGAAISDSDWSALAQCGLPPLQGYGLTEASPVVCSNRTGTQQPGTIGVAVKGVQLKVDSEKQLWLRGPNVMLGYYKDQAATEERIRDGWLATGDLVEQAADGHYRIIGRTSSVIVLSTGFKVSPELIESRLVMSPWIERVLIFGQAQSSTLAILWPSWDRLPGEFYVDANISRGSLDLDVYLSAVSEDAAKLLGDLPKFMQPRRFLVERDDLESGSSLLNAKGVLRRDAVTEQLAAKISAAYSEPVNQYLPTTDEYLSNE